jgi:hypothetical protein
VQQVKLELLTYGSRAITIETSDAMNEGDVCAAMALVIESALADSVYYPVVSSESFGWLPGTNGKKYKPDLLICSAAFLNAKPQKLGTRNHRSAVPIEPTFVKFVLEAANVSLKESELGKLAFYLGLMNNFQTKSCGIIFNASNFVYMESSHGAVSCIEWGLLADPGSLDYIVGKILSVNLPQIRIYDNALKYAIESIPLEPISMTSLLGFGRFGRVYSCFDKNGNRCAMKLIKVVEDICFKDIRREYEKLTTVYAVAPDLTLNIRSDLMHFRDEDVEICA